LLPANDPARLDVSVSRAPNPVGATPGSGSSRETNPSAARPRADRDAAAANARDRAAKFRAQGDAARARVPVLDALLAASAAAGGPLSLLARAMEERRQVRVRTRHASGVRGEAVAYLKAFDRHLNLILADVTETSASRGTRVVAGEAGEKERRRPKLVRRTRRLAQIFVRGEQVVLVAVVGDGEGGARDCVP
jgi:small nuclear ribonucleoprotein (snRNP)-like protein